MEKKNPLRLLLKMRRKREKEEHLAQIGPLPIQGTLIEDQGMLNVTIAINVVTMRELLGKKEILQNSKKNYNNKRYDDRRNDRRRSDDKKMQDDRIERDYRRKRDTSNDREEIPYPQKK